MSKPSTDTFTFSTQNVSADGARVTPDETVSGVAVTELKALAVLRAFAAVPSVDLVDVDARIYLAGTRGKWAVQNVSGRLFAAKVPESANSASEHSPEEIIELLTGTGIGSEARGGYAQSETVAGDMAAATRYARSSGWRGALNSWWALATLAAITAAVFYFVFAPEKPAGVEFIGDAAKLSRLHAELNGQYGLGQTAGQTVLVLDSGKLTGYSTLHDGVRGPVLFTSSYRLGERDGQVVLVTDKEAVLERRPDHSLAFLNSVYPRQEAAK